MINPDLNMLEFMRRNYFRIVDFYANPVNPIATDGIRNVIDDICLFMKYSLCQNNILNCECKKGYMQCQGPCTASSDITPFYILKCSACGKEVDVSDKQLNQI
jgi:hypothetical protein